jgi:hypothetical protein
MKKETTWNIAMSDLFVPETLSCQEKNVLKKSLFVNVSVCVITKETSLFHA